MTVARARMSESQKQAAEAAEKLRESLRMVPWPKVTARDTADFRRHNLYFRPNPGPLPPR